MFISSRIADSFEARFFSVNATENVEPEDYIFLLVQKGAVAANAGDSRFVLSENDVLLLTPGVSYTFQFLSRNQIFLFECKKGFLDSHIPYGQRIACNSAAGRREDYRDLVLRLERIGMFFPTKERQFAFIAELYALLDLLLNRFLVSDLPGEASESDTNAQIRVKKIQQYIEQHYQLPIFLQTLADEMFLSPQYLSKFIRQHMGITFNKYLNNVRLEHAFEELTKTDHSITEIAYNNGFSNASAFNKQFREYYTVSPTHYRREHAVPLPEALQMPAGTADVLQLPERIPEQLDISFGSYEPFHPSWKDTINIGVLSSALSAPFHDSLAAAQKTLQFRYVRFNNAFTPEIVPYIPERKEYKFANLDMIFDFFREINLIPFIEVCYKPPKLSLTPQYFEEHPAGELFDPELPLPEMLRVLEATLRHFIHRYGRTEVSKWRFEVWAKHDEQLNYLETPGEYWEKYTACRRVIQSLLPDCAVGGPGYNTAQQIQGFEDLLEEMGRRQIRPDFFSIYVYCYSPVDYDIRREDMQRDTFKKLSSDPDFAVHTFDLYRQRIDRQFPEEAPPLFITEFNSGLYGMNHLAASAFQAAFICKNMLDLFRRSDCIAYWHFADITYEANLNPHVYATGMGLIEQHGIPKPGLFSYTLLSKLKMKLVASGSQYIAATNARNKYQFLACHYIHYSNNFCFTHQSGLGIGNTYDVFEETESKRLTVNMRDLPRGRYKCIEYVLNRSYGSLLDKFIHILNYGKTSAGELNYMLMNMHPEEIEYYQKEVHPRLEIRYLDNVSGTLSFDLEIEPHEVRLISLERRS